MSLYNETKRGATQSSFLLSKKTTTGATQASLLWKRRQEEEQRYLSLGKEDQKRSSPAVPSQEHTSRRSYKPDEFSQEREDTRKKSLGVLPQKQETG